MNSRPVIIFILRFLAVYGGGVALYQYYLNRFPEIIDPFSWEITRQVAYILQQFFQDISATDYVGYTVSDIYCADNVILRIVEGCNGASTMILFAAFVIAFSGSWKKSLWFIPLGIVIIHLSNIFRIFILGVVAMNKPEWSDFFHQYFLPAAIYGTIFLLWVFWVRMVYNQQVQQMPNA
jgi:exosortase family protein XrtF